MVRKRVRQVSRLTPARWFPEAITAAALCRNFTGFPFSLDTTSSTERTDIVSDAMQVRRFARFLRSARHGGILEVT